MPTQIDIYLCIFKHAVPTGGRREGLSQIDSTAEEAVFESSFGGKLWSLLRWLEGSVNLKGSVIMD